jgi:hypothetical protein
MELPADSPEVEPGSVQMHEGATHAGASLRHRGKLRLITKADLDGRTTAAKEFDRVFNEIVTDLGGAESLSQIERSLVAAYAGADIMLGHLCAKMITGQQISLQRYANVVGAMVRLATRLGIKKRVPSGQTLDLGSYLADKSEVTTDET